jgi:uncharacterized protein (TIGR02118 family)
MHGGIECGSVGRSNGMIKLIVAVKRKAGMSAEEFHRHWRTRHAELVRTNPASKRYIRKYIQCHTLPSEYAGVEVAFDGTAELWFDSVEDKDRFYSDPTTSRGTVRTRVALPT